MNKVQTFLEGVYIQAFNMAYLAEYSSYNHEQLILSSLKKARIPYSQIGKLIPFSKSQWIADVLEITQDFKKVLKNHEKYKEKFVLRTKMHLNGEFNDNLMKSSVHQKWARRSISMYKEQKSNWTLEKQHYFRNHVLNASVYFPGIIKGNGAILNKDRVVTCAHVIVDETSPSKHYQLRSFITANCGFGIVRISENDVFRQQDIAYGTITYYQGPQLQQIQFNTNLIQSNIFTPIRCIQVGLLYDPDQKLETFKTNVGFIEKNLYSNNHDYSLNKEMGLLIHDCYGLWGTSGSPLWDKDGRLIGIHNAWNQDGHNVSMIIHNQKAEEKMYVIRQYERRAISSHVIAGLVNIPEKKPVLQQVQKNSKNIVKNMRKKIKKSSRR